MKTTVEALKTLYVKLGGSLTDTYADIAGGAAVDDYTVIPDIAEAVAQLAGTTIELPAVSVADNGDVLQVIEGAWAKGQTPSELPAVSVADNGNVLQVIEGAWAKGQTPSELPAVSAADNGKVLKVAEGAWVAGTDNALPAVTNSDQGKTLMVVRTGPSTAEWQLAKNPAVSTLTKTTDSNGAVDLGTAFTSKQVVGFSILPSSSNQPDSYTYEVKYTHASLNIPYSPVIIVKSEGTAYSDKSITFEVKTI